MIIQNQYGLNFKENGAKSQKIHCPKCHDERRNKTDKSLSINLEGRVFKCHHCNWSGRIDGWKKDENFVMPDRSGWSNFSTDVQLYLKGRGIGIETIKKNTIIQKAFFDKELQKDALFIGFPYRTPGEKYPVNVKWRRIDQKQFRQEKDALHVLYNAPLWQNDKELIICEGEMDVLSFNEAGFWNATTLSDGAINENDKSVDGKLKSLYNSFQWIEGKEKFYLCLDNDAPGRRLREELIKKLGDEKCLTIDLPNEYKDINEVLQKEGIEAVKKLVANAKPVPVSGIFYVADIAPVMLDNFDNGIRMGERTHMGDLDSIFRWKKGAVNLWTGYANTGKTIFFLQCALTKSILDGWKWCVFSPENYPACDFYDDIIEMYVGKNVTDLYGNKMNRNEYIEAMDFINRHFIFVYPEENHTIEALHEKFTYLVMKEGIDGVLIDPYNQLDKSFTGTRVDEEISEFMNVVKRFTTKHNISYNIVIHPKNPPQVKPGEPLPVVDKYDLNGGAMWSNKSDHLLSVYRPNAHQNKLDPVTHVHQQKVKRKRTGGDYGYAEFIWHFRMSRFSDASGKFFCDPRRLQDYLDSKSINEEEDYF
jgi:twinkle protein